MRCIAIESFGGIDKLTAMALPRPKTGKGEVLVRAVAAGVNPVDCLIRAGRLRESMPHAFPLIPGWDVAGVVDEIGEGAGRFRKGDRVWALARKPTVQWGCYAEFVSVPENHVAHMPAKLLFEEAASVPVAALAARQCLFGSSAMSPLGTVLVHGAAGGVGHFAVQLARLAGSRVIGTAGAANQPFVLGLGADAGIDYTAEDFVQALRRHAPEGVDLVVDTMGGDTLSRSYAVLKEGGRLVSTVEAPDAAEAQRHGIKAAAMWVKPGGEQLRELARLFDQKKLRTQVQKIYSLSQAADAHRTLEGGHVQGKLVLNL